MRSIELARVFYRVEAETKGLEGQLKGAEKSLDRLGKFILANPVAAAGALGVALVGIGIKAAEMAAQVDRSMRLISASMKLTSADLKGLTKDLASLSTQTGRTQAELAEMAKLVAGNGVESITELRQVLAAGTLAADATGGDLSQILTGLDGVLDSFSIKGDRAEEVLAKLFVTAQGKTTLPALLDAFERLSPVVQRLGVDFETTAAAVATLINRGQTTKQVVAELGTLDLAGFEALARESRNASTGIKELRDQAALMRDDVDNATAKLAREMDAVMIRLGDRLKGLKNIAADYLRLVLQMRGLTPQPTVGEPDPGMNGPRPIVPPAPAAPTPEQTKAIDELQRRMEDMLTAFSATAVDNTLLALKRFQEESAKVIAGLPAAEAEAMQRQVDAVVAGFRRQIEEIRTKERADTLSERNAPIAPSVVDRRIPLRTDYTKADKAMAAKTAALAKAEEDLAEQRAKNIAQARAEYQAMEQAARGALQIASALGIMNADLAQALTGLVQFGAGLKELKAFNANGASGLEKLSAGLGVVGAAVSALSAIGSLLGIGKGPSPNEIAREKALKQNNEAIRELSRQIGHLGSVLGGISGTTLGGVLTATAAGVAAGGPKGSNNDARLALERELQRLGLSMLDLREVARGLGLAFVGAEPTFNEMQQLLKALRTAELTRFAETFGGQMQELQDIFEVFDITDPLEQLRKLVALFNDPKFGSPALRKALAGLDLSTPEGRAAAEQAIQELVKRLGLDPNKGGITLDDLGGMSPDEFRQALLDLEKRLDELGQAGDPQGEMNQFAVQRTITEVQANLLASLLTTDAYWNEQTARNTAAIVAALGASLPTGSIAPPVTSTAAGAGVVNLTVNVTLPGVVDLPTATAIGGGIADGLMAQMNAKLGSDYRARKLLSGNVTQV